MQEDRSTAGRPASQRCQPPLSLPPLALSLSFLAGLEVHLLFLAYRGCKREFGSATSATSTTTTTFSSSSTFSPHRGSCSSSCALLSRSFSRDIRIYVPHIHAYIHSMDRHSAFCPWRSHNKKVETSRLCGHVPHPSRVCW